MSPGAVELSGRSGIARRRKRGPAAPPSNAAAFGGSWDRLVK